MKFLQFVLIIRLLVGALVNKKNKSDHHTVEVMNEKIFHPAEFDLR
jgi:hypothetical protein